MNKVATKIDLCVELAAVESLPDAARARLRLLARHRLNADCRLAVTSQTTRNQARNLDDARAKVIDLIRAARVPRRRRVKDGADGRRPSAAADGDEAAGGYQSAGARGLARTTELAAASSLAFLQRPGPRQGGPCTQ